jgi:hypothetical protein
MKSKCVECRKDADAGSFKHPYCKKCFKKVWKGDYDKYFKWLREKH